MLRFNNALETKYRVLNVFQYILCYGSTGSLYWKPRRERKFQYILCYGSTSSSFIIIKIIKKFQYILCYGSTVAKTYQPNYQQHFNTSYVTVQPSLTCLEIVLNKISIHPMLRFNHLHIVLSNGLVVFQYILCYGSTVFH